MTLDRGGGLTATVRMGREIRPGGIQSVAEILGDEQALLRRQSRGPCGADEGENGLVPVSSLSIAP